MPTNLLIALVLPLALYLPILLVPSSSFAQETQFEIAQKHVQKLKSTLKQELMNSIQKKGVAQSVEFCHEGVSKFSTQSGSPTVTVGRVSNRPRNPKNVPQEWIQSLMKVYQGTNVSDLNFRKIPRHRMKALQDGSLVYVEPIFIGPVCLSCHGSKLNSPVQSKISKLYPNDLATGYKVGEFRGLFWARVSKLNQKNK